jgi:hypothetical protein
MPEVNPERFTQSDAAILLIRWLRKPDHGDYGSYGYGVYLPALVRTHLARQGIQHGDQENRLREMMPMLYAAAWDLCRRGVLRPGVRAFGEQATPDGASGNGYSITPFGAQWLTEADRDDFVPTEPERFAQMLAPYRDRFGPSFQERAQEAIRCYGAHAYLACCTMCGAAAEAVLLATAIAKADEETVLKQYNASGGRRRVENLVLGKAREELRNEYLGHMTLLKYWRDQASHGKAAGIRDNEAYTSLALLLRLAIFVNENWAELAAK